jgi:hypothetical protein
MLIILDMPVAARIAMESPANTARPSNALLEAFHHGTAGAVVEGSSYSVKGAISNGSSALGNAPFDDDFGGIGSDGAGDSGVSGGWFIDTGIRRY